MDAFQLRAAGIVLIAAGAVLIAAAQVLLSRWLHSGGAETQTGRNQK